MVKGHCIRCGKLNIDDDKKSCFMCDDCQEIVRRQLENEKEFMEKTCND